MKVGLSRNDYPEKRCIIGGDGNTFLNLKFTDPYIYLKKFFGITRPGCSFTPFFVDKFIDSIVVFNDVVKTKKSWISIFESLIPRCDYSLDFHDANWNSRVSVRNDYVLNQLDILAQDNCRALFAVSKCTYNLQSMFLEHYPEYKDILLDKTSILPPPQKVMKNNMVFHNGGKVKFIFIGRDFYRKGGAEVLLAFDKLISDGIISASDFELTIIGDYRKRENYIFEFAGQDCDSFYYGIEKQLKVKSYVNYICETSNENVMKLLSESHVGLLPTWADTYGYSVLEMQAFDIPVITTNVRALDEINYSAQIIESSFLNDRKEIMLISAKEKNQAREEIIAGLATKIVYMLEVLSCKQTSFKVKDDVIKNHDPVKYFNSLYGKLY